MFHRPILVLVWHRKIFTAGYATTVAIKLRGFLDPADEPWCSDVGERRSLMGSRPL